MSRFPSPDLRVGVDTGGTFTDFVLQAGTVTRFLKVRSTPKDPSQAILAGLELLLGGFDLTRPEIVHGSTVATNALIERRGARTALLTPAGFEDVLEIGRQARPEPYNLGVTRPPPLVPRELRFGVPERVGPEGTVLRWPTSAEIRALIRQLLRKKPESVAISLLFSFLNTRHERVLEREVRRAGIPVSASYRVLPEYREYERTSTVIVNAYLMPLMADYLVRLHRSVKRLARTAGPRAALAARHPLRVMQSSGGSISAEQAALEPVRIVLSGPAGGVVGAESIARVLDLGRIITFDMGGTSTDVALSDGATRTTNEMQVAGVAVAVPVLDIHTVGAGGGSIASIDQGGALRVGPNSAGADPGPACYGMGEELTVTDANLVLGRFGQASLLGGELNLDYSRTRQLMRRFADRLSKASGKRFGAEAAALGIIRVVNANMERALRVISVERGHDPRLFTLVSFGGAGGLHVCELARGLRVPLILIPESPGTLSARGMLLADVIKDLSRTLMLPLSGRYRDVLNQAFRALESAGRKHLRAEGFPGHRMRFSRSCAMRYRGQSFELEVPWVTDLRPAFINAHRQRYGYADDDRPCEIVSARLRAIGVTEKPTIPRYRGVRRSAPQASEESKVFLGSRSRPVPVFERSTLRPGHEITGPAIVREYSSTTLVLDGFRARVDPFGNVVLTALV